MAKTSETKKQPPSDDFFGDVALPEDGRKVIGDVEAYWDYDKSAIRFKPQSVKLFDNKSDKKRPSCLIIGETTAPTLLYQQDDNEKDEDGNKVRDYKKFPAGTSVGVFYKPGMKGIVKRSGVDCYLKKSGEKDTGKPNPMILFELVAGDETHIIPIVEDHRDKSIGEDTVFHGTVGKPKSSNNGNEDEDPGF